MRHLRVLYRRFVHVSYRMERMYVWTILSLINPLTYIIVWRALDPSHIGLYISYYLCGMVVTALQCGVAEDIAEGHINSGALSRLILRPYSIMMTFFFSEFPYRMYRLGINTIISIALLYLLSRSVPRGTMSEILLVGMSLACGFLLSFAYTVSLGFSAFWLGKNWYITDIFEVVFILTAGVTMPLDYFPIWASRILIGLPFASMYYIPISIMQGRYLIASPLVYILLQVGWVLVAWCGAIYMLHSGLRRYTANGA